MIQIVVKGINVVIIDSFNFIQLSLDKCAAMFDLALRKGSFPHRLNKPQFYALEIRGLPPRQYYNFDKMTAEGKLAHEVLEASQAEEIFSFAHEIYSYNLDDTVILMAVIMSYITSCLNVETEISSLIKHAEHFSPSRNPLIFRKSEERREQEHLAVQRAYKTIMNERRQARREGRDSRDEFQDIKDAAELLDKIRELMYLKSDTLTVYPTAVAPLGRKTITISSYVNSLFLKYVVAQNRRMPICRSEDSSLGIRSSSLEEIDFLIFYSVCFTDETVSILNSTEQKGIQIDGRNFK